MGRLSPIRVPVLLNFRGKERGGANPKNEGWLVDEGGTGLTHEPFGLEYDEKVFLLLFGVLERGPRPFRFLGMCPTQFDNVE